MCVGRSEKTFFFEILKVTQFCYFFSKQFILFFNFSIIDDIKIPEYIIKLFDYLSNGMIKNNRNMSCRDGDAHSLFGVVKHLKQSIKEMAQNPQNITEIQTQIELYVNKNKMLELELESMNNKIIPSSYHLYF